MPAAVACIDAALRASNVAPVDWIEYPLGSSAIATHGIAVPEETLIGLAQVHGWLLGPHDNVSYPEPHRSMLNPSGTIRKHFGLFANIRPAKAFDKGNAIVEGTDLVIVRENTEGFYADRNTFSGSGEFMPTPDIAIAHGIITREGTERIAREAFGLAMLRRKKVTIVHKANVLRMTSGLFLDVCRQIATEYPEVEVDDFHIDAMTVHLVRRAYLFDVIVAENMFGDILSDLAGEIAGSLGIAASINCSATHAMAQSTHGSAPDIAGQNSANPIAMILSGSMLLDWLGKRHHDVRLSDAARRIETAVATKVNSGMATTDIGGTAGTREFTASVVATITAVG